MLHAKGTLLTIDVGDRTATTSNIDDELASFIGGRGVATKLAHDRIPFDADPLGPENRLYLASGPLQQSRMSFTGRMNLTGLSPLTDGLLSSNAGGYLSRNFVATGHSVVEIVGESDELLAIHVTDDGVEFEPVSELEEAGVPDVTDAMNERHGLESENLVTIGPAGEHEVRFASVMTYDERAFGRGGLGAALGAKNVKCVSFAGESAPELELPNEDLHMEVHREAATSDDIMRRQGTSNLTEFLNDEFSLPTRYFNELEFEHAADIGGNAVEEKKYEKASCSVCAFACKLPTRDEASGLETEGPEYETVFSFGSNCGVDDVVDVMKSNELCDRYGMDTISCGVTVAAYLAANDEFGNADLVHELVEKIAFREGDGDLLAEGVARIHEDLGVDNWAIKGLEHAAHDGRVVQGQGLSYAVANRGGDHMYSTTMIDEYHGRIEREGTTGKAETVIENENRNALRDSGIICQFGVGRAVEADRFERLFDAEYDELQQVGANVVELERHFNNRRGFDDGDDRVPYDLPDLESSKRDYYRARGWNDDGTVPADAVASASRSD
ncbi:aldehyde ferredoxin oxidoreductase C-terminal domain-containing protein [Natrarchaeobius chitinivorans]|uniref:Aldehyde ferredoxin oxidoreductase n=1 Tax=Natrarchaeobius chitinivorans TaxID=1679083 RepID=A0A3N6LXC8_NATCH|nr:aldehyde ferredoxin oxidoreductase C-terminal domain-containing protein [Natrarchaeobius chitinivorans]RQG93627.1 aldehyde ferredoxin oxidoreductase [Natrarchaeobius chitinivorans]